VQSHPVKPLPVRLEPKSASAGSGGFTLIVHGSGFASSSVILWNGQPRPTEYISPTEIRATIPASDLDSPGLRAVTVMNPALGGGTSKPLIFTITPPHRQ